MHKTLNFYYIICLILLFGCDRQIPIPNIDSKPVLSINAFINDSLEIAAKLSTSESIQKFDTIDPITDAVIHIQNENGSFKSTLNSQGNGKYTLQLPKVEQIQIILFLLIILAMNPFFQQQHCTPNNLNLKLIPMLLLSLMHLLTK